MASDNTRLTISYIHDLPMESSLLCSNLTAKNSFSHSSYLAHLAPVQRTLLIIVRRFSSVPMYDLGIPCSNTLPLLSSSAEKISHLLQYVTFIFLDALRGATKDFMRHFGRKCRGIERRTRRTVGILIVGRK